MARGIMALGIWLSAHGLVVFISNSAAHGQQTGSWRASPPNSKAIIYDEKGRRLFWDANGQVVGRYSFATGKYVAELPGRQRDEKMEARPKSPGERNQPPLAIVIWGRPRSEQADQIPGPKLISGPIIASPTIFRHGDQREPAAAATADHRSLSSEPLGMP